MVTRRELMTGMAAIAVAGVAERSAPWAEKAAAAATGGVRPVTIAARPSPIAIDPTKTALIVVDMQNDFGSKGGMFDRAGVDISGIEAAVAPTSRAIAAARAARIKILFLKMAFKPDLSDLGSADSVSRTRHVNIMHVGSTATAPDGKPTRILIRDTWGTSVIDELKPARGDIQMYKTRFSGFYRTELDDVLRNAGISDLVVTGCTTSICVESTIRDAMFRDYRCVLLSDCAAEPIGQGLPRSNHDASLLNIEALFGWVTTSSDFITALKGSQ